MLLASKLALARAARGGSRRLRRGGTTVPGRVLLRLEPRAIALLGRRLGRGSAVISATNGKTTTAAMIAAIMAHAGVALVHNRAGSNMNWGVATALLDAGHSPAELGLFEVDEAWLAAVARDLEPDVFVLSNLFRDQLDRYGELELLADRWAEVVAERAGRSKFLLNADDPLVADLGRGQAQVTYFGVEDASIASPELQHAADSKRCRNCGAAYAYESAYLAHLGHYRCQSCGRERPRPAVAAERVALHGMTGAEIDLRLREGRLDRLRLPLPGLYNVYNAIAAAAAAVAV